MKILAAIVWLLPAAIGVVVVARGYAGARRWNWARALRAGWGAALLTGGVWALIRVFDWLSGAGGPLAWTNVKRVVFSDTAPLTDAVLRLGAGAGTLFAGALVAVARLSPRPRPALPLAGVATGLGLAAALAVCGAFASGPLAYATALPLDFVGFVPVIAAGMAVGFLRLQEPDAAADQPKRAATTAALAAPPPPRPAAVPHPPAPAGPEPAALAKQAGLIKGNPTFAVAAKPRSNLGADPLADRVWAACGGAGPTPTALIDLADRIGKGAPRGMLLGDLAIPTEAAVTDAATLIAALGRAARVLVVCADPRVVHGRLGAALTTLRAFRPGPLCAGDGELRDALAQSKLPVVALLNLGDLGGQVLGARTPGGMSWLTALDLIVLVRVDQLAPIEATHMALTLRRLGLALERERARPAWVALAQRSAGSIGWLEGAVQLPFEPVALGASTAGVRVWARPVARAAALSDISAAQEALAGVEPTLEDATGELSSPGDERRAVMRPGYHGRIALALIDDRNLAGRFRARTGLAHRVPGAMHTALWYVPDSPLARFLLRDDALAALEAADELPSPRPLAGLSNRFLAAAHLEAALHEGRSDERALRRAFGDAAVDDLLRARTDLRRDGRRARWNPDTRTIEPSSILTAPAAAAWPDPRRETVTANVVEVRSAHGAVLRRVDRRMAPTRFHPHRVFRARGQLYQVGGEAMAAGAHQITVGPAPSGAIPTDPDLTVELVQATWLTKPEQHRLGKVTFARGTAAVDVREQVAGAIPRGAAKSSVKFPAVTAEYPTQAAVVLFGAIPSRPALRHAARLAAELLPAHLLVEPEDVDLVLYPDGFGGVQRPALALVDRHVGGIGVADALDPRTIHELLRWTWGVLYGCPCMKGCDTCTPPDVLAAGPDKVGALKLLGG